MNDPSIARMSCAYRGFFTLFGFVATNAGWWMFNTTEALPQVTQDVSLCLESLLGILISS